MNETEKPIDEQPPEKTVVDERIVTDEGEIVRHEEEISPARRGIHPGLIAALILAIVLVFLFLWYFFRSDSGGGQPVPAPRNSIGDMPAETLTNQTLTLSPEQVQNAGITIETVGEQDRKSVV